MKKLYKNKKYLLIAIFALAGISAFAQRSITGKVVSADDNSGIPGVNILEKGTSNGTVTDVDGNYSISVGPNATLVFSFVGYITKEVVVGSQSAIDVSLVSDVTALAEVVVVGYGTQDKKEITSAVSSVKAEEFNRGNVNDPSQLLAGKVAGLQIVREGSNPNQGFAIRLRGLSTVGANTEPLVVIDGVIGASLATVDPNDIATMDVLKDGSAAAIYGVRGSAGVILITTKRGTAGKAVVEYNPYVSVERVARRLPVLSASEFRQFSDELGIAGGDRGADTDWLEEITRPAVSMVHSLAVSGGTNSTSIRASVNFRDIDGVLNGTGFQNLNTRINISQKALDNKLTINAQVATNQRASKFGFNEAFRYSTVYNPTAPIRSAEPGFTQYGGYYQETRFDFLNPVAILEQNRNEGEYSRLNVSIGANYAITDNLVFNVDYSNQTENELLGRYFSKQSLFVGLGRNGLAERDQRRRYFDLLESYLSYSRNLGDLNATLLGGYSFQQFVDEDFGVSAGNFISDFFTYDDIESALDIPNGLSAAYSNRSERRLVGFFGRLNLNYKETYFFSTSYRSEGSTTFGIDNKRAGFFAVSAGADIAKIVDLPMFNNMKFRIGYGETGQLPPQPYLAQDRWDRAGNFPVNGQYVPGYRPTVTANPNLGWEKKSEFNVGVDFAMLDSRLTGTIDFYDRTTSDFITFRPVPVPPNPADRRWENFGSIRNWGLEIALNYLVKNTGDWRISTGVNFATFSTEIEDLGLTGPQFQANVGSPGQNGVNMIRVVEGGPVGQIQAIRFLGINENGQAIYQDVNGDGEISPADEQVVGRGLPKATINWTGTATYKNFDFNFLFRSAVGHDLVNQYRTFYESPLAITSYNIVESTRDLRFLTSTPRYSSLHVEDGDYLALDNITLGYTVPNSASSKFSKVRGFVTVQNPFIITKYRGADPEVRYGDSEDNNNVLSPGIDRRNTWVRTRTFTLGFNITF